MSDAAAVDLLARSKRRTRAVLVASASLVGACGLFAILPARVRPLPDVVSGSATTPPPAARPPIEPVSFSSSLWAVKPPPPPARATAPAPPPPPPPPLKLQLLGILTEQDGPRAVLFDPESEKASVLAKGQSIAGRTVESIDASSVSFRSPAGHQRLSLQREPSK